MTGKILSLVDSGKGKQESDPLVIERLEQALEMAKSGGAVNVAAILIMDDGMVLDCWANSSSCFTMVGAMESLKRDFMDKCVEGR